MKQPAVCIGACAVLAHFKLKWLSSYSPIIISLNVCIAYWTSVDIGRLAASCSPEAEWLTPLVLASLYTAATSLTSQPPDQLCNGDMTMGNLCHACLRTLLSYLQLARLEMRLSVFRELLSLRCINLKNLCAHHQEEVLRIPKHPQLAKFAWF